VAEGLEQSENRRELCARALRYALLGLLTAGGAVMFFKRRRLVREGKCINGGICAGCKILGQCGLPAAFSARTTLMGADNGGK